MNNRPICRLSTPVLILFALLLSVSQAAASPGTIAPSAEETCPVREGMQLPPITVSDLQGQPFDLNAAVAETPTVLVFYRGGWCPYCNTQLSALAEVVPQLEAKGVQLLAVSADRPSKLRESIIEHDLNYTLLSDSSTAAAQAMGLAFKLPDELVSTYKNEYEIDLEGASGMDHHALPVPAVYVIDTEGNILFSYANTNYKTRLNPELLLAAVKLLESE